MLLTMSAGINPGHVSRDSLSIDRGRGPPDVDDELKEKSGIAIKWKLPTNT
jgi:hypothetical protein